MGKKKNLSTQSCSVQFNKIYGDNFSLEKILTLKKYSKNQQKKSPANQFFFYQNTIYF